MRNNRAATTARTAPATKEKVLSTNRYEQLGIHSSKQGLEAILSRREAAIPTNSRVDEAASKARARQQTRAGKKLLSDADVIAVDLCLGSGLTRKRQEAGAFFPPANDPWVPVQASGKERIQSGFPTQGEEYTLINHIRVHHALLLQVMRSGVCTRISAPIHSPFP